MQESEHFCASYITKFSVELGGIWCALETCWPDGPHLISFQLINIQGRKPNLGDFIEEKKKDEKKTL